MNDSLEIMFESCFGLEPPQKLRKLLENQELVHAVPIRFLFHDKPFVFEIQYFSDPSDGSNYDSGSRCYRFAVSSDGHDVLVDLKHDDLPIIQEEFGSRDYLGVTVGDLLAATVVR